MANELKITDIVDEKALLQVVGLKDELNKLKDIYTNVTKEIGVGIKVPVSDYNSLNTKVQNYQSMVSKLNIVLDEMNRVQQKQSQLLRDVNDKMGKMSIAKNLVSIFDKLANGVDRLNSLLDGLIKKPQQASQSLNGLTDVTTQVNQQFAEVAINYEQLSNTITVYSAEITNLAKNIANNQSLLSTYRNEQKNLEKEYKDGVIPLSEYLSRNAELKQRIAEVSAEIQKEQNILRNHSQAVVAAEGSYNQMNAAMLELQKRYKELNEADRTSEIGEGILKQASELNGKLKEIDAGMGNYQRNVGNYSSAFNGLGYQVTQVVRELPALSSGFNTFMIAIGNNLPMLVDEIDRARKLNAKMAADKQKTVPVWKQVTSAIFNWQTALVVGLTLVTMYWKDISKFFQELFTGAKGYDATTEAQKKYNEAMREGAKNASQEVTQVEILYKASQDQNRSLEERKKAIDKLQKDYPKYFGNMSQEEILAGKAATAYDKLRESIIKQAQARVIQEKLVELNKIILEDQIKIAEAQEKMEANKSKSNKVQRGTRVDDVSGIISTTYEVDISITDQKQRKEVLAAAQAFDRAAAAVKVYQKNIDEVKSTQELLVGMLDVTDLFPDESSIESNRIASAKKERDILEELNQTRIDLIEEDRERELAQNEKDFQEKMKGLDKESELYLNYEELMRREALAINEKYDEEERKEREEALKRLQEDAEREVEILGDKYSMRALTATKGLQNELESLSEQYSKGLIDAEQYEEKRSKLTNKYALESAELGIEMIKKQLETENLSAEKRMELNQALADAELALKDAVIASNEEQANAREEALARAREGFEALRDVADESIDGMGELMGGLFSIFEAIEKGGKDTFKGILAGAIEMVSGIKEMVSNMYESQIEELEKEQEANEEANEKEIERIEKLAETGAISEEEAEARKRAAEDKTAAKNAEVEKKKAELMTKQAKFEKAMNIAQTIMATSLAVTKALPNLILAGWVGAMGAVQLAAIIAQPIPKYAKGTKDHKGGLAIVGDGGKQEGVITNKGLWVTPDKPTLVDLPKHAVVVPDIKKYMDAKGLKSDLLVKSKTDSDVVVNVNNDYSRLEHEMMSNRRELRSLLKVVNKIRKGREIQTIYSRI